MSDVELEAIRRKKYAELQRKLVTKGKKTEPTNADEVLNRIFKDRAWEVFNSASHQFPSVMPRVKEMLVKLASSGELKEVTGEELYLFLADLGLKVRLDTKIEFVSHGELKSLGDKLKEELRKP
jgi:DNA-binding TFAR19-related protein (PDSD5 family)